jgi:hypothetical protein
MALGKNLWRPFPCDAWEWLQDHEPLAQRLLLWMWTGPDSTASGLLRLREYSAAGALKSKPAAIRRALDELAKDGRLSIGATASGRHDVWLDRYLSSQTGIKSDHRQLIRREIEAFADGLPKAQAIEDWAVWDAACRKAGDRQHSGSGQPEHTEQNRTEQKTIPIPKGIGAPAVAVDKPKRAKAAAEIPPDLGETIALFASLNSTENEARKCYLYFESKGWKRGRDTIKSWKATCEGWVRNSYGQTGKGLPPPKTIAPTDPDDVVEEDGFTPRQRRDAEAQLARMKKENDDYDAAQLAKRSQAGLFGPQSRPLLAGQR